MRCRSCHSELPEDATLCPDCGAETSGFSDSDAFEYAAFISYRHLPRDQEVAIKVQKALESFKMPRGVSMLGRPYRRLGKCFRDEDELAVTHSLPDRILEALKRSSSLVVVCSPDTQESMWVQREIEAFVEMHGRERVFAVLADGSSAESIPNQLRTEEDGIGIGNSSPLAADLRPGAAKKHRDEMLRLIAAIAGCGYDDLKQRDRSRKRKRTAIASASAVVVVAAIAGAVFFASGAHRDAQIAESQRLAAESERLLSLGDRYGAIQTALEALPKSESSNDRPLVPEARTALENALEINRARLDTPWLASYEIRTDAPLGSIGASYSQESDSDPEYSSVIAINEFGGYFAISDGGGNVCTYDMVTGRKLADCIMPKEATPLDGGLYCRTMGATENYLIVANGGDSSVIATFDAKTGEMIGSSQDTGCPSFSTSIGGDLVSMSFPLRDGGYSVAIADVKTGESSSVDVTEVGMVDARVGTYFNTPGNRFGDNYSVFGNRLFHIQVDGGVVKSVELAYPEATSLKYIDGLVLVASAEPIPDDGVVRHYAIEAFDSNLKLKWKYEGSFSSEMIVNNGVSTLLTGAPIIHDAIEGRSQIVASVGRDVIMLDASSGKILKDMSFDQTIVGVGFSGYSGDNPGLITVACADGTISCKDLSGKSLDPEGDSLRLVLPFPIRWASFAECDGFYVLLAIPADSNNRIVSFRTDWTQGEQSDDQYSLDELIDFANDVLKDGGKA